MAKPVTRVVQVRLQPLVAVPFATVAQAVPVAAGRCGDSLAQVVGCSEIVVPEVQAGNGCCGQFRIPDGASLKQFLRRRLPQGPAQLQVPRLPDEQRQ